MLEVRAEVCGFTHGKWIQTRFWGEKHLPLAGTRDVRNSFF